ncbi:hypothetical protein TRICHSKD4_4885 [Roseibium sp. TrichSKD4]|uniref:hypothetical protein n=1 Tax=Roseibium sp. TrichSKD4 TaxID=744980 RepID=UPI0001E5725C|nr:hypothetical protein [Roseibium sp. TrichSKD4]EFO29070.1 hypothetical protein TRICHSKD4_4885 [Roseibium sp. TrichSKD4]
MGTLLDFASAPRPSSRLTRTTRPVGRSASAPAGEVVIFPGVRYERNELDLAARIGTISKTAKPARSEAD